MCKHATCMEERDLLGICRIYMTLVNHTEKMGGNRFIYMNPA